MDERQNKIRAMVTNIEEARRKYLRENRIIPISITPINRGRHNLIITKDSRIYFMYKRAPFYKFAEKFPKLAHPSTAFFLTEYSDYGDSINAEFLERAVGEFRCDKLVIFYGEVGKAFEGDIRTIYEFAYTNELKRVQFDGEEIYSFPCSMLRDCEQLMLRGVE